MTRIPYDSLTAHLKGHRVLLVGGAGFIGHHLALELSRLGGHAIVVDNLGVNNIVAALFGNSSDRLQRAVYQKFLLDRYRMMQQAGVVLVNADARRIDDLMRVFRDHQPTKIVHLSAIASAVEANKDPGLCFDLQLMTLRNLLELCRTYYDTVDQIMLMSSSTVYGDFDGDSVDETTRPRPRGIYANTKYMAERLVRTYADQYGLGTTIIRPSALYGERCISQRVSQIFIENALKRKPLLLEGGGDGRLDFTYIDDLVNGMVRALAQHKGHGDNWTYNLTLGDARTILDLAKVVKEVVPGSVFEERPRAVDKPVRGTLSIARARERLGFEPRWNLENGYRRYCEWYAEAWRRVAAEAR